MKEIDPDSFVLFLENLKSLTRKEREVFDLYLEGKSAKEIVELMGFTDNALKFHNKNLYSKLGVTSRKELLLYAALMGQNNSNAAVRRWQNAQGFSSIAICYYGKEDNKQYMLGQRGVIIKSSCFYIN